MYYIIVGVLSNQNACCILCVLSGTVVNYVLLVLSVEADGETILENIGSQ